MHTIIFAFGQVHARAIAEARGLSPDQWRLGLTAEALRSVAHAKVRDVVFCETARDLAQYDEIVSVAAHRGFDVPASIHTWGVHSATLSGAFKIMEGVHGAYGMSHYVINNATGDLSVFAEGRLLMMFRSDGAFRIAPEGGDLCHL